MGKLCCAFERVLMRLQHSSCLTMLLLTTSDKDIIQAILGVLEKLVATLSDAAFNRLISRLPFPQKHCLAKAFRCIAKQTLWMHFPSNAQRSKQRERYESHLLTAGGIKTAPKVLKASATANNTLKCGFINQLTWEQLQFTLIVDWMQCIASKWPKTNINNVSFKC